MLNRNSSLRWWVASHEDIDVTLILFNERDASARSRSAICTFKLRRAGSWQKWPYYWYLVSKLLLLLTERIRDTNKVSTFSVDSKTMAIFSPCSTMVLLTLFFSSVNAWVPLSMSTRSNRRTFALSMVESLSLENTKISDDHEKIGQEMAGSIQRWLDAEWMPQEVHVKMAESCKQTYIACRQSGEADLMTIMTTTAEDLTENWSEYNADAFVNAWDISNYVSDFLTSKSGIEGCDCSATIHWLKLRVCRLRGFLETTCLAHPRDSKFLLPWFWL